MPVERAFRGSPEPGADVIREVASVSAPVGRTPLPAKGASEHRSRGKAARSPHPRACIWHPCLLPHVARLGMCGRGGPSSIGSRPTRHRRSWPRI
jgi:hypothetical protein